MAKHHVKNQEPKREEAQLSPDLLNFREQSMTEDSLMREAVNQLKEMLGDKYDEIGEWV